MISSLTILTFALALATTSSAQSCDSPCAKASTLSSSCTFPTFPNGSWQSVYEGLTSEQKSCLCDANTKFLETKAECAKCHVVSDRGQEKEKWGREIGQIKWVAGRVCQGSVSEAVGRALGDAGQEYGGQNGNNNGGDGRDDDENDDDNGDDSNDGNDDSSSAEEITRTAGGSVAATKAADAGQVTVTATPEAAAAAKDAATTSEVTPVATEAAGNGAGAQEVKIGGVLVGAVGVMVALLA